ncbi:hypothetical protein JR316_0002581 [Psilocybe cubensis]|uniref:Uncharacterized protein n=2 Tax=Psilocybe cubensis TaxID=181762 RepID=A0ACB8HCR9_PSICU|nr:hypothetical protein JR316_0002581 [Psilocybe cubensis]KAH9485671.1 hypothetical protein JR316_0002581 [Psilocybe cubensis]
MPVSNSPYSTELQIVTVSEARRFPVFAKRVLDSDPVRANLILPTLLKCYAAESKGQVMNGHLWIVVHVAGAVYFIASCTRGYMGDYPLFIYTPIPSDQLIPHYIRPALTMIATTLFHSRLISPRRIYSVFAQETVTLTFASVWTEITGIAPESTPYYHAKISYATQDSVARSNRDVSPIRNAFCEMRPAVASDVVGIADLCFRFAKESEPFVLSWQAALEEARILVQCGQVWVYTATFPGRPTAIASIVATTRNTDVAAAITKVYTHPDFRSQGCAERLVRKVCFHLLQTKKYIVLYVGLDNRAANVYQKVGFLGIGQNAQPVPLVDNWLEIGFDRNQVKLGHW